MMLKYEKGRQYQRNVKRNKSGGLTFFIVIVGLVLFGLYQDYSVGKNIEKLQSDYDEKYEEYQDLKHDSCLIYEQFCD